MKKSLLKFLMVSGMIMGGVFILILIGFSLLQVDIIRLEQVALRNRFLINLISLGVYLFFAFYYVPKLIHQKIAGKAHLQEKITPQKIKKWSWWVFIGLILFDLVSFQLPFYLSLGG